MEQLHWDAGFIITTFVLLLATRALHVFPIVYFVNHRRRVPIPHNYSIMIWFSGLRGAIAFALSLLYEGEHHQLISS